MSDLFGEEAPAKPFRDIRSQRSSVAEEKAQLALILNRKITRCPSSVANGSVNLVREWRKTAHAARKVYASTRSSVQELTSAIASFDRYDK